MFQIVTGTNDITFSKLFRNIKLNKTNKYVFANADNSYE